MRLALLMRSRSFWCATATFLLWITSQSRSCPGAEQPSNAASPRPEPSDPCGGPGRLLATANRPTVGYSACAVKRGTAVFELGYQNQVKGTASNGAVQSQVPQTFIRLGVASRFEFDLIGPNYEEERIYKTGHVGGTLNGVADSGTGFKFELPPRGRWTIAFDGLYTAPNGSKSLTAGTATITANTDASYALSSATSIGTTIALSSTGREVGGTQRRYGVTTPSLVLTTQIPNFYQFYTEYVLVSKVGPNHESLAFTDFGVQKLLGSRTEIDVEYGHGFTGDSNLKFNYIGAGLVLQFR